ncbi:MAG: hypothetical protein JOZ45_12950 [Acidobacteriaceae bacterium]|nr:hypothetical protein [Acidobacteriaceae bacterium]
MRKSRSNGEAGERGSALLVVLIMAAVIAILLYRELAVAAFEAQREKEQQLIDRGEGYAHAVKLYVRRMGSYPPSLDALEDTNRMRFLRRRFKDPFTGEGDWRLLHAGPGGMLIDSKVKPAITNVNGQNTAGGSSSLNDTSSVSPTASSVISEFSQPSSGESSSRVGEVTVSPVRQRPPAIPANSGGVNRNSGSGAEGNSPDPTAPLLTSTSAETAISGGAQSIGENTTAAQVLGLQGTTTPTGTSPAIGPSMSGGIAGVASRAEGRTLKTVHDQTDYSLWEFYYDPLKDPFRLNFGLQQNPWGQGGLGSPETKGAPGSGTSANAGTSLIQTPSSDGTTHK